MAQVLNCFLREKTGKSGARKLRSDNMLPAIIYGHKTRNIPVGVRESDFLSLWKSLQEKQVVIDLVILDEKTGKEKKVKGLLQDYQHDILSRKFIHIDFHQVKASEKVRISIPVEMTGEAPGEKKGGIVDQLLREVEVEALPGDLPGNVVIDISRLEVGDSVTISDLDLGEKVSLLASPEDPVVTVLSPKQAEQEIPETEEAAEEGAGEEEAGEPEVISEKTAEERRSRKESEDK